MSRSEPHRAAAGRGSERRSAAGPRLGRAWRALPPERRLAAGACVALFVTLFLPWYQETVIARGLTGLRSITASLTGWEAFSFVEAAVLLTAAAVLLLLFLRAEGDAFHLPGGDGGVITAAGVWTCVLIVWRIFDKTGTTRSGQLATTTGIEWGIFVALGVGGMLAYAGTRIRHAREPEPPLPGEAQESEWPAPPLFTDLEPTVPSAPARRRRVRPRSVGEAPRLDRQEIRDLDLAEPPTVPWPRGD